MTPESPLDTKGLSPLQIALGGPVVNDVIRPKENSQQVAERIGKKVLEADKERRQQESG